MARTHRRHWPSRRGPRRFAAAPATNPLVPVSTLLLLKLTVTPLLVAGMSMAARRFGPMVGGLLMGLPWMTGPVLFFLALERGNVYLAETARGALLAVPLFAAFGLVYVAVARRYAWPASIAAAAATFAVSGWLISGLAVPASVVALLGVAALLVAHVLIAKPGQAIPAPSMPWWDIPARMIATAILVGFIALSSDYLGPTLSGIVSSYPAIITVVATFTHSRWGADAVTVLMRGVMLSLVGFAVFFWVIADFVPSLGLIPAYLAAAVASLVFNFGLLLFNRWRSRYPVQVQANQPRPATRIPR
jgi:hypothetical protein